MRNSVDNPIDFLDCQLEDDVVTKNGYLSTMKNFALNQKTDEWVLLEFSYLGFIGSYLSYHHYS